MSAIDHKEDDQKEEKGIAALAIYCQNLFHRSLITPWLTTMGLRLEETRQKFNAWVSYLGVLATGHASLEHRLRFSTEIRDMVMELLCLLERNLRRIVDSEPKQPMVTLDSLDALKGGVERLLRIGNSIRKSSTASLASRVKTYSMGHDDEDYFYSLAFEIIKWKYPDANADICKHLATSVKFRRQKLRYLRRHEQKLQATEYSPNAPGAPDPTNTRTSTPISGVPSMTRAPIAALSQTSASTFKDHSFWQHYNTPPMTSNKPMPLPPPSTVSMGSTVIDHDHIPYPRPPVVEEGSQATCDWCPEKHPATFYEDSVWWRRHVRENIEPYVCVAEECIDPPKMFRKESEWRQHMRGVHGVRWPQEIYKPLQWYCDIGHPGPLYFSREDLKKHLTSAHSNIFTPDQQMIILEQNSVSSLRAPNTCPLCDSIPNRPSNDPNTPKDPIEESKSKHSSEKSRRLTLSSQKVSFDIDFEDMSDVDESDTLNKSTTNSKSPNRDNLSSINLERHISAHLRYIAFISIRNLIGNDESSSDASAQALGHLGNSNSSAGSQANDFDHSPLIFNENLESRQNNDDTIPDSRFDWGGSDVEDKYIGEGDEVIESVIRSGAFQSHQQATDTKVTRNSSIFGKLAKDIRSRFKGSPKPLPKPKVEPQSELELKPSLSDTNSLASCIVRDLRENNNGHEFLPYDREVTFVTPQIVGDILRETGVENANELSSFALMHAKKLFLILVMMTADSEKLSLLADLKRSEITDKSLPIMIENNADSGSDSWYSLETDIESKHELLGNWSRRDRHLLMAYQWFFLAPIFGQGTFRFKFHPNRILPYLSVSPKPANTGFFSEVSRVEIHKAHLDVNFLPTLNINKDEISIAIKKAKYDEALAVFFEKEVSNLHKLQQYKSPHLIKPIAAYQIGEDQCLIFLWAHGGNLSDYWRNFENQRLELESLHWIFGQIKGICSALDELHAGNTRHGDLKPENILWFQDESNHGIFQIADFGLAGFHEKDRQTKYRKGMMSFTPSGTSRYEPPEMDEMRATHGARSRHYDIWSMGCVLLESLVWFIYGYNSVETFRVSTTCFWESYDTPDGKKYTVHPYVDACMSVMMSDLEKYSDGTSAYKELLTLVREGLLVVEVSEIYESCPNCRETAEALHMAITDIVQNSESHESYLAAVQLKYPVDEIIYQKQRKTVYNESGGLVRPPDHPPSPLPRFLIRPPTEEFDQNS